MAKRIYAKRTPNSLEENLFKRKQSPNQPSSSSVSTVTRSTLQRVQTSPQSLSPFEVHQLQATMGNRALSRMMVPQTPQGYSASPSPVRTLQRTPIAVRQRILPKKSIQRWKWPWRRNETPQQKYDRYTRTMNNIETAIDVLRVGHGLVMLPLTIIDLISNVARIFTGTKIRTPSNDKRDENRIAFHKALNGQSMLVALMAGKTTYCDLKILKYMPWNVLPWIIAGLNRWRDRIGRKRSRLNV